MKKILICMLCAVLSVCSCPVSSYAEDEPKASQETTDKLNEAQSKLDEAQNKVSTLAAEYAKMSSEMSDILDNIDEVNSQIEAKKQELATKQEALGKRISSNYKYGDLNFLDLLVSASSFDEFTSNFYYFMKIATSDAALIQDVKNIQADLDNQKASLVADQEELSKKMEEMSKKEAELNSYIDSLSADVKDLLAKRDEEIEASRQAAAEAAAAAAQGGSIISGGSKADASCSSAIVDACYRVPSPGSGWCAKWVSLVYQAAGCGFIGGNACDQYVTFCNSSDKDDLVAGMIIAVPSHPHTTAGRIYGHVGIYIGNNKVMDNVGYIRTIDLNEWISYYGAGGSRPRWGWA